ncbi:hypothetical protein FRB95_004199 [Tulasnella sp. JGI-2019a]|nr:hypothetical protein FRB95_004199 [Tulasnella sp. JGI-2019a]
MFGQVLPSASSSTPPFATTWSIPVGQYTWDGTMSSPSTTASVWIAQTVPQQRGSTFIAYVDEPSEVLNIILHIVYETPVAHHGPSLNLIDQALSRLSKYGIQAPPVNRGSDVWTLLLNFGHRDPVRVYAIAASHAIEPICIAASELTLKVGRFLSPFAIKDFQLNRTSAFCIGGSRCGHRRGCLEDGGCILKTPLVFASWSPTSTCVSDSSKYRCKQ